MPALSLTKRRISHAQPLQMVQSKQPEVHRLSRQGMGCSADRRRKAFDDFQAEKIAAYTAEKCSALAADKGIVRNRRKIQASVRNAAIFLAISAEFGSFYNYLCQFTQGRIFYETGKATSPLSDAISTDLQKRGMKFVGSTIIYAYLQAVGILYSHDAGCDLYRHS